MGADGLGKLCGSASSFGYAVLDITPQTLRVSFKDIAGQELYCWQRGRDTPQGESCT